MKETMLDKCIKANFRMVGSEIGIASVMGLLTAFFLSTFVLILVLFIPLIVTIVYIIKMYKKLFYTSLYGETAAMYQSLPVTASQMTAAKIFTAAAGNIIITAAYMLAITFAITFMGGTDGIMSFFSELTQIYAAGDVAPAGLILLFINATISFFWIPALIFFSVAACQVSPGKGKKGMRNFFIIISAYAVSLLVDNVGSFLISAGLENLLIANGCGVVFGIAVLVICFQKTVNILERNYEIPPRV